MDHEEFRKWGHGLVDWIADYRQNIDQLPVMSPIEPGEIRSRFGAVPPREGNHVSDALGIVEKDILPGITHWNHPAFFAYFPSNTTYAAILGDLLASGLGAQCMSWQTSPAATELEEVVVDWLRQMFGLSPAWSGVAHDTASTATLCALLCARERATGFSQQRGGLQSEDAPLIVYVSSEAHSSVEKAARLAGFGQDNVRLIETDDAHALRLEALQSAIDQDLQAGHRPCALVATTGTTPTTALDPVVRISANVIALIAPS